MTIEKGPADVRNGLFGGKGDVRVWSLLTHVSPPFTAVLSCELAPGAAVGAHVQQEYPEVVIGVAGDGEATVDHEPRELCAGDCVYLPLGAVLSIRNRSLREPLQYLIIKARG